MNRKLEIGIGTVVTCKHCSLFPFFLHVWLRWWCCWWWFHWLFFFSSANSIVGIWWVRVWMCVVRQVWWLWYLKSKIRDFLADSIQGLLPPNSTHSMQVCACVQHHQEGEKKGQQNVFLFRFSYIFYSRRFSFFVKILIKSTPISICFCIRTLPFYLVSLLNGLRSTRVHEIEFTKIHK